MPTSCGEQSRPLLTVRIKCRFRFPFVPAGRAHGADDFLPVMMYVLARSNLSALQLDVEYMMELMDPSLTLGEGANPRRKYSHTLLCVLITSLKSLSVCVQAPIT